MGVNAIEAALEQHDASLIVIDEVVGQCVVVACSMCFFAVQLIRPATALELYGL